MGDVIDLSEYRAKRRITTSTPERTLAFLAICLSCFGRWVGNAPLSVNLFMLECPHCGDTDSFVAVLPDDVCINGDPVNGA